MSTWTTFEPKVVTVIPVYSPLPGDWFVGAYLSHWDEKVQQQVNILSNSNQYLEIVLKHNLSFIGK